MSVSGTNSLISLQESQLIQMLQQQSARARAGVNAQQKQTQGAGDGQILPGTDGQTAGQATAVADGSIPMEPLDPALSPENINALLKSLEAQQASLNTNTMLGGSMAGPGGKTLVDYLTSSDNIPNDAANDDSATDASLSLADALL